MTFERKIVVGLEDIKAVSFACEQCQFKLTMSPDDVKKIPENCPSGHEWYFGQDEPHVVPAIKNFYIALAKLRMQSERKAAGFRILLEFDEPKA